MVEISGPRGGIFVYFDTNTVIMRSFQYQIHPRPEGSPLFMHGSTLLLPIEPINNKWHYFKIGERAIIFSILKQQKNKTKENKIYRSISVTDLARTSMYSCRIHLSHLFTLILMNLMQGYLHPSVSWQSEQSAAFFHQVLTCLLRPVT